MIVGITTSDSSEYRYVRGQLRRYRERVTVLGLNENHNHDVKNIFKSAERVKPPFGCEELRIMASFVLQSLSHDFAYRLAQRHGLANPKNAHNATEVRSAVKT